MAESGRAVTSNTEGCFRVFVGQQVRGYFRKAGDSYLIFEDGRAFVLHHETGAYWVATAIDVARDLDIVRRQLQNEIAALKNVLTLAGAPDPPQSVNALRQRSDNPS